MRHFSNISVIVELLLLLVVVSFSAGNTAWGHLSSLTVQHESETLPRRKSDQARRVGYNCLRMT